MCRPSIMYDLQLLKSRKNAKALRALANGDLTVSAADDTCPVLSRRCMRIMVAVLTISGFANLLM